jgi:hypothetical protein
VSTAASPQGLVDGRRGPHTNNQSTANMSQAHGLTASSPSQVANPYGAMGYDPTALFMNGLRPSMPPNAQMPMGMMPMMMDPTTGTPMPVPPHLLPYMYMMSPHAQAAAAHAAAAAAAAAAAHAAQASSNGAPGAAPKGPGGLAPSSQPLGMNPYQAPFGGPPGQMPGMPFMPGFAMPGLGAPHLGPSASPLTSMAAPGAPGQPFGAMMPPMYRMPMPPGLLHPSLFAGPQGYPGLAGSGGGGASNPSAVDASPSSSLPPSFMTAMPGMHSLAAYAQFAAEQGAAAPLALSHAASSAGSRPLNHPGALMPALTTAASRPPFAHATSLSSPSELTSPHYQQQPVSGHPIAAVTAATAVSHVPVVNTGSNPHQPPPSPSPSNATPASTPAALPTTGAGCVPAPGRGPEADKRNGSNPNRSAPPKLEPS